MTSPIAISKITPAYWRASLSSPPFNLWGPDHFTALSELLETLQNDEQVRVIVLDSSVPEFFISHYDLQRAPEIPPELLARWPTMMIKLATLPVISIAAIRGRCRGAGSEIALACDIRFGSKEKLLLSQAEVSFSLLPGGGGLEFMPRTMGRGRVLEIVCGSDEFDADTAELYGYINRSVPDADFDAFVDKFARRVAGWDKAALAEAKRLINKRFGLPTEAEIEESFQAMMELWKSPQTGERLSKLFEAGLESDVKAELDLAKLVARFPCP